jgi:hypothetical protein
MSTRRTHGLRIARALSTLALIALFGGPVEAASGSLAVAWDRNAEPTVTGYVFHYGVAPGVYATHVDVGNVTAWTETGLTNGVRYYSAVTAIVRAPVTAARAGRQSQRRAR